MADSTPSMDDVELNLDNDSDDMALAAMFEPQPPPEAAPGASQAPERVKFAVPAVLSFDGYEETFEVSVLNLSTHGVACTGPQGLAVHDRLRLAFRLNLAADAHSFPCEVMWVHNGAEQKSTYGLRFEELDESVRSQVGEVVRERAEGRAAEWPMPIMPPPAAPVPALVIPKTRWSSVIAGSVAGVCVGVAVTLVVTLWLGATEPPAPAPQAAARADQPEMAPGAGEAPEGLAVVPFHGEGGPAAPLPEPDLESADGVDDAEPAPPAAAKPAPPATKPAPAAAAKPASAAPAAVRLRKIGNLRVEEAPDKVALTLLADGAVSKHDVFWLQNPPRVVVDIPQRKSGFVVKLFEVGHPLVNRLRVGQHPGKVRFVIETGKDVAPKIVSEHQGNSVRVEVRRR